MKDIQEEAQELIKTFLEVLIPDNSTQQKNLSIRAKLHRDTFRSLKNRNSLNSDTLFKLLLSHGIKSSQIKSILKKKGNDISPGMVEWIKFGSKLEEKDIKIFLSLLRELKKHYMLKK